MVERSEIEDVVPLVLEPAREIILEVDPGMIGGKYDAHAQ
jgi:hypothetical protein